MDDLSLSLAEVSDERIISTNSIIFYSRPNVARVWLLRGCLLVWFDTTMSLCPYEGCTSHNE